MARRLGDRRLLATTLVEMLLMLDDAADQTEQLHVAAELASFDRSEIPADVAPTLVARSARVALAAGDASGLEGDIARYAREAREARQPNEVVWSTWAQAAVAFLRGRLSEAERLAGEAFTLHEQLGSWGGPETYALHMVQVWREQGRLDEVGAPGRAATHPGHPPRRGQTAGRVRPRARRARADRRTARTRPDSSIPRLHLARRGLRHRRTGRSRGAALCRRALPHPLAVPAPCRHHGRNLHLSWDRRATTSDYSPMPSVGQIMRLPISGTRWQSTTPSAPSRGACVPAINWQRRSAHPIPTAPTTSCAPRWPRHELTSSSPCAVASKPNSSMGERLLVGPPAEPRRSKFGGQSPE